ncbi:MAG: tetratricopeptide repeat protein, partial [Burkholderiales bacterium]|nr:tetratricopeptide repeat protein [Burkholderiales bacterium]
MPVAARAAPPVKVSRRAREAQHHWQLGQAHARAARWDAAARSHAQAARLQPQDALYAVNHARALWAQGDVERATAEALRAHGLDPQLAAARELAVQGLLQLQRSDEAVALLARPGQPRDHAAHAALGRALQRLHRPNEAVAAFFDALALAPQDAASHHNLGQCFDDLQMYQEAAHCFETALMLGVGDQALATRGLALFAARSGCHWGRELEASLATLRAEVQLLPDAAALRTAPFAHAAFTDSRAEQHRAAASAARFITAEVASLPGLPLAPPAPGHGAWRPGTRPLRLGYVSADFHDHATANLMAEVLELHDRSAFDVHLYSHGPDDGSTMRARLQAGGGRFIDLARSSDHEAARRIRADGIDLLIDLKGHTKDHRLGIFAQRPAPLQATFLGFPGTTGAAWMDYVIGDTIVTPLAHAADYSEKIAQLPASYQPNDRQRPLPPAPSRASQGLPDDALVLCCFNQPYKISAEVMDSWCRLLAGLPNAVLWLFAWGTQALPNLQREAAARGIAPQRLIGAPRVPLAAHMARLQLADLFIDTWPYNAHTTASDALWAGVPVVTTLGPTFASRVGASLLNAVGLPELVAADRAGYEALVLALAGDAPRRRALRAQLAAARTQAPLFDSRR